MPGSDESEDEQEVLMKIDKLQEEIKLKKKKLDNIREKKRLKNIESESAATDQNPVLFTPLQTKEDEEDDVSLLDVSLWMYVSEDKDITSCNADERNTPFENDQKDNEEAEMPPKVEYIPDEPGSALRAEYTRTEGQCSTSGAMYEVKVLALLYMRASARGWDFLLGTNVGEAGKFDDIRLAYTTDSGVRRQLLVQLGHKVTRSISKAKLLAEDSKKHKFSLLKYYKSFRELRDNFATNKVLNSYSQFSDIDFVIFTNAAAEVSEGMFTHADLRTANDSVLNVNGKVFNFSENQTLIQEFKKKHASYINDDGTVEEFFEKFYIFSDQTRENNLERETKQEIMESYFLSDYGARELCASLVEYIYIWWGDRMESYNLKRGDFPFKTGSEFLNECKVESPKLKFSSEALLPIKECLSNDRIKIINCVVDVDTCSPACDILAQSVVECSVKFLSATLEHIEDFRDEVMRIWPSKLYPILVIKYESGMPLLQNIKGISALAKKSLDSDIGSKLFLVSKQGELGKKLFPEDQQRYCTDIKLNCEIIHLTEECKELVLQKIINFQGSYVSLHSVLEKNNASAVDACLLSRLMYSDEILQLGYLQGSKLSFYIDRVLTRKHFLKKNILQYSSDDIFAISGANEEQIKAFLNVGDSNTNTDNIHTLHDINDGFGFKQSYTFEDMSLWYSNGATIDSTLTASNLVLRNLLRQIAPVNYIEKPRYPQSKRCDESNIETNFNENFFHIIQNKEEFSKLCMKNKRKNVHWLELQDSKFIWKESNGHLRVIKRNISAQIDFISINNVWDIPDRIVLITGSSGMGKSTLLAHIAVNSKEKKPETCIIQIDLRECSSDLNNLDSEITLEQACGFLIRNSVLHDECYKCSTNLFFNHILRHSDRAVVLIDGFDEIYPENECKLANLIKCFLKLRISKLWITTRHHLTSRLEGITRTISYELQPLKISESEELVRKYLYDEEHGTPTRLKLDRSVIIDSLLENPLHCEMFAEAAQSNTDIRDVLLGNKTSNIAAITILALLEAIVTKKFEIYFQKYKSSIEENKQIQAIFEKKKQFIEYHQLSVLLHILSIGLIKPTGSFYKREIYRKLKDFIDAIKFGSGITGMINTVHEGKPLFEHQIYAEYFLALWLMENCNGPDSYVTKMIFQAIIFDPRYTHVVILFNQMATRGFTLHSAILEIDWRSKTLPEIQTLNKATDVNAKDKAGRTALHLVMSLWNHNTTNNVVMSLTEKQKILIRKLLRCGAKTDIEDGVLEWSPFRYSNIRTVPWNIVAFMMKEKGATKSDMNELIGRVQTQKLDALAGLAYGVSIGNRRLVSFLLKNGVDVNERVNEMGDTAIIIAAARGQYETLKFLHQECFAKPELRNYNGDSPLHWACLRGHMSIVKYLINKCQTDANMKNYSLYTPLLAAARDGHLNIIKYLIVNHNSDPRERTKFGQSALCLAAGCKKDDADTVKYLVTEFGLNPKDCKTYSCLPASIALVRGNFNITKFFIDKCGVDLLHNTEYGDCTLHFIIIFSSVERVKKLVSLLKLSLNFIDNHGRTLFMWSLIFPRQDLCEYLRIKCTNIKDTDAEGNTALHFYIVNSAQFVRVDIVNWLVEICHIDPNVVNIHGLTALQCAVSRSQNNATRGFIKPGVIEYLRNQA